MASIPCGTGCCPSGSRCVDGQCQNFSTGAVAPPEDYWCDCCARAYGPRWRLTGNYCEVPGTRIAPRRKPADCGSSSNPRPAPPNRPPSSPGVPQQPCRYKKIVCADRGPLAGELSLSQCLQAASVRCGLGKRKACVCEQGASSGSFSPPSRFSPPRSSFGGGTGGTSGSSGPATGGNPTGFLGF